MKHSDITKRDSTSSEQQLSEAIRALHSDDVLIQNSAVEQLIQLGAIALPELLKILQQPESNHSQAMFAVAQIGDSQASEAILDGLKHDDERVRAYAAQGLVRINHPDAVSACVQTINDNADELHVDITPAVSALADLGILAVDPILNLLMHENEMTRLHSQRALELLIKKRHGFIPGQGFPSSEAEAASHSEWQRNGNYDYCADYASRLAAVAKWRQWLDSIEE